MADIPLTRLPKRQPRAQPQPQPQLQRILLDGVKNSPVNGYQPLQHDPLLQPLQSPGQEEPLLRQPQQQQQQKQQQRPLLQDLSAQEPERQYGLYQGERDTMPAWEQYQKKQKYRGHGVEVQVTSKFLRIAMGLVTLTIFALVLAALPLMITRTPKPELHLSFPPGIKCATCAEINAQNPSMLEETIGGQVIACRDMTGVFETDANKKKGGKKMYAEMERCWKLEDWSPSGEKLDEWLRPVGWGRKEIVRWMQETGRA